MSELICCKYSVGGKCTFNSGWQGKNVVLPDSKLYFMLDGEIFFEIEKEKFIAKKGDLILIPANVEHTCGLTDKKYMKKVWCHFQMLRGKENYFENLSFPYKLHTKNPEYLSKLFDKLIKAQKEPVHYKNLISSACISEIVCYFLSNSAVKEKTSVEDRIDALVKYMKENYSENPDVETLAGMANYSLNHFIKKFKAKTGYTPAKYITLLKIDAARSLLQHSNDSINTVMEKTGFYDTSHFIKLFKKHIGYSPKKFSDLYSIK